MFRGLLSHVTGIAWSNVCRVLGSTYIRVSLKCTGIRSKHRSGLYNGEKNCGQS